MKRAVSCVQFPMKPAFSYKVCQSLSKFGVCLCICFTYRMLHSFFFCEEGEPGFWDFGGGTQKGLEGER